MCVCDVPAPAETAACVTCADDFLDFHTGDVDLFGKLVHSVIGVLVGKGVDVNFDPWGN